MPEAAEVTVAARQLHAVGVGRRLAALPVTHARTMRNVSRRALEDFVGATVVRVEPVGKWILVAFDGVERRLGLHLRMSGQLLAMPPEAGHPDRHVHAELVFGERPTPMVAVDGVPAPPPGAAGSTAAPVSVWFRDPRTFGEVRSLVDAPGAPDVRSPEVTAVWLHRRAERRRASVKAVLLDQSAFVAGIGSYLADEILHDAGIDPRAPARELAVSAWSRILSSSLGHIEASARVGGVTLADEGWIDLWGRPGGYGEGVRVHARARCGTCDSPTRSAILAGRSARWCPACQHPRRRR